MREHRFEIERGDPLRDDGVDLVAGAKPQCLRAVTVGRGQFRLLHYFGQSHEHLIVGAGDRDPLAVSGLIMAVRTDVDRVRAHSLPHIAEFLKRRRDFVEHAKYQLVEREVDAWPSPVASAPDATSAPIAPYMPDI